MHGVVFDFDGVIARSMELHAQAYRSILEPLGIRVTDEEVYLREGARSESIIRDFLAQAGLPHTQPEVEALSNDKQAAFRSRGLPELYPGARDLVAAVQSRVPTALVTGTRLENLQQIIPDLLDGFDAVLSQESYRHDKPHPEPYLRAAEALGLDAGGLVAVENAIRGVQSARAAGYGQVLGITTTMDATQLRSAGATAVLASHEALRRRLLSLVE